MTYAILAGCAFYVARIFADAYGYDRRGFYLFGTRLGLAAASLLMVAAALAP